MGRIIKKMIDIFQPMGTDWMNFALSRRNPYNYHHIVERRNGGDISVDNGAILTRRAHTLLHLLETACPEAYNDLQNVFVQINLSKRPPTDEIIREIDEILFKVLVSQEYEFNCDIDLSYYRVLYHEGRKKLRRRL